MEQPTQTSNLTFTPDELASLLIQEVSDRQAEVSIPVRYFISTMDRDERMMPGRPGELITILGRPHNYKTGFAQHLARSNARYLKDIGAKDNCVIYVTWEQSAEEMAMQEAAFLSGYSLSQMARGDRTVDLNVLSQHAVHIAGTPMFVVGHSSRRRERRPYMNMQTVMDEVWFIREGVLNGRQMTPTLIVLDYLQRIPNSESSDYRIATIKNVDLAKDLAILSGATVVLVCQAKREVDYRDDKQPTMYDGAETSNIEQASDKILSVMMPKVYFPVGSNRSINGFNITVTEEIMFIKVCKQKNAASGHVYPLKVEPALNRLTGLDLEVRPIPQIHARFDLPQEERVDYNEQTTPMNGVSHQRRWAE